MTRLIWGGRSGLQRTSTYFPVPPWGSSIVAIIGHNLWGVGGTVRTIYNPRMASLLRDVELSPYIAGPTPAFNAPTSVKVTSLVDGRSKDHQIRGILPFEHDVPASEELLTRSSPTPDCAAI